MNVEVVTMRFYIKALEKLTQKKNRSQYMNIAFLTTLNPADINNWSGTTFHLFHALSRKHHVKVIGQNTLLQAAYFTKDNYIKKKSIRELCFCFREIMYRTIDEL
ncbi:hypothetical protein ACIXFJ_13020 [Bacteroides fragilis]